LVYVFLVSEDSKLLFSLLQSEIQMAPDDMTPLVGAFTTLCRTKNCSFPPQGCQEPHPRLSSRAPVWQRPPTWEAEHGAARIGKRGIPG